jgi:hypothetical protein
MTDKPVRNKKDLDKGLKRSVGKPARCVSKGWGSSNTTSLPNQFTKTKGFEKRAQYYAAEACSSQTDQGDEYHNLKEIIFIAVADCITFPDKAEYKSNHTILDENTNEHD